MLKIALVDNESLYSANLIDNLQNFSDIKVTLYAPKFFIQNKSREFVSYFVRDKKRVWTPHLYFLQIWKTALKSHPDIIHIQFEFFGIHSFGPVYSSLFLPLLLLLLKLIRLKIVITLHQVLPINSLSKIDMVKLMPQIKIPIMVLRWFMRIYVSLISILVNGIVVHQDFLKKCLVHNYHLNEEKVYVIPHGITFSKPFLHLKTLNYWRSKIGSRDIILYFGVLSPRKSVDVLIRSYSLIANDHPNSLLVIVGDQPPYYKGYFDKLQTLVKELEIEDKVLFLGSLPDEDVHAIFSLAKIVVFPQTVSLSASGSICWAIQHRKPIIAFNIESFREFEGFIIMVPKNIHKLAFAISKLIDDKNLRESLSKKLDILKSSRSWNEICKRHIELYYQFLARW